MVLGPFANNLLNCSIFQINHAIIWAEKFAEQFPQKVQKIVQNFNDR
jgi:hypothetical protein